MTVRGCILVLNLILGQGNILFIHWTPITRALVSFPLTSRVAVMDGVKIEIKKQKPTNKKAKLQHLTH